MKMEKSRLYGLWMAVLTALLLLGVGLWIAGLIQGKPEEPALRACLPLLPWLG